MPCQPILEFSRGIPQQVPSYGPHHRQAMDKKSSILAFLYLGGSHMATFEELVDQYFM